MFSLVVQVWPIGLPHTFVVPQHKAVFHFSFFLWWLFCFLQEYISCQGIVSEFWSVCLIMYESPSSMMIDSLKEMQSCIPLNKAINPASKALVVEIASVKVPTITPVWFWMIPPMPDVIQSGIIEPSKLKFSKEGTLASVTHHLYDILGKRSLCISIKTLCKFCFVPMICIVNGEFRASLKLTIW